MASGSIERKDSFGDNRWKDLHERFATEAKEKEPEVVFLGSSHVALLPLTEAYKEFLDPLHCLCFGSLNDSTMNLLWRLENGELDPINPKVLALWAGEADAGTSSPEELAGRLATMARLMATRCASSQVFVLKLLPSGRRASAWRDTCRAANQLLEKQFADVANIKVIDVDPGFVGADGELSHRDMFDYCHLTQTGYRKVIELIQVALNSVLNPDVVVAS